jgi:transcription initiation factor TFIIIB Brf1 subunit/transcription initiation factor TFIIB
VRHICSYCGVTYAVNDVEPTLGETHGACDKCGEQLLIDTQRYIDDPTFRSKFTHPETNQHREYVPNPYLYAHIDIV